MVVHSFMRPSSVLEMSRLLEWPARVSKTDLTEMTPKVW